MTVGGLGWGFSEERGAGVGGLLQHASPFDGLERAKSQQKWCVYSVQSRLVGSGGKERACI